MHACPKPDFNIYPAMGDDWSLFWFTWLNKPLNLWKEHQNCRLMVDSVLATRTTSSVHIVISYSKSNSEYGLAEVDNLSEKWQTRLNAARLWQIPRQKGSHKSKIFAFLKMRYCSMLQYLIFSTWSIRTGKDLWQIPSQRVTCLKYLLFYFHTSTWSIALCSMNFFR